MWRDWSSDVCSSDLTNARHLPPAPPQQPPKKRMTDHLLTRARRGSIAECSFADLQGGSPKVKPLPLNESDRGNTPNTPSNSRSGTPPRLKHRRRKPYLSSTNHEPNTYSVFVDADHNLHPLLDCNQFYYSLFLLRVRILLHSLNVLWDLMLEFYRFLF